MPLEVGDVIVCDAGLALIVGLDPQEHVWLDEGARVYRSSPGDERLHIGRAILKRDGSVELGPMNFSERHEQVALLWVGDSTTRKK